MWCKAFEKFQTSCPDIKHVDGQNFTALVSRATTVRQKGRLCIVLRSCANIIVRQRLSEIEAVKAEGKHLKIATPKQMLCSSFSCSVGVNALSHSVLILMRHSCCNGPL